MKEFIKNAFFFLTAKRQGGNRRLETPISLMRICPWMEELRKLFRLKTVVERSWESNFNITLDDSVDFKISAKYIYNFVESKCAQGFLLLRIWKPKRYQITKFVSTSFNPTPLSSQNLFQLKYQISPRVKIITDTMLTSAVARRIKTWIKNKKILHKQRKWQ